MAETRLQRKTGRGRRSGSVAPLVAVGGVLLVGGVLAFRYLHRAVVTPPTPAHVDGGTAAAAPDAGARLSEADKLRMLTELEQLPRASVAWRGVVDEDYLAVLSAVDAALCLTPAGARDLVIPAEEHGHIAERKLVPETMAVGRYLLATGELPPRVAVSLETFLRNHPASAGGAKGWTVARL